MARRKNALILIYYADIEIPDSSLRRTKLDLFATRKKSNEAGKIKDWARDILDLDDDAIVMVSELQCREENCPPIETVIAVMETGKEKQMFKIHKAIDELTETEVRQTIENGHRH